jgi:hypothetical protein
MATPSWQVTGQYYETCSCDFVCPCVSGQLAVMPTKGFCTVAMAFQIERGSYGTVPLDGLGFIVLLWTPEEMGKGNWSVGVIADARASAEQHDAITSIASGSAGRRVERGVVPAVPSFGLGYLTVWLGFSASATAAQWALHDGALLSSTMATSSTAVAGGILIAAGAYQLTPLKTGCLARCQSPLGFLMSNWRDGSSGAFVMGFRHGVFCLGCCWALMAVLFVVGVMNLAWVGVLTLFILAEKMGPTGARVSRAGGAILIALGAVLVAGWV